MLQIIVWKGQDKKTTTQCDKVQNFLCCSSGEGCGCSCTQVKITRYVLVHSKSDVGNYEFQPYHADTYCKCVNFWSKKQCLLVGTGVYIYIFSWNITGLNLIVKWVNLLVSLSGF